MAIPILMYHQIDTASCNRPTKGDLSVSSRNFKRQMGWMHALGYRGLSMRELLPHLREGRRENVFGLTFDDGYKGVFENARPVLAELGFTATCYIVANRLGQWNQWEASTMSRRIDVMSVTELHQWHHSGNEVGSHTLDHYALSAMTSAQARTQIFDSKAVLEDLVGSDVQSFCYPYGEATSDIRELVREAGYTCATTTKRGLAHTGSDLWDLPRVTVHAETSLPKFLFKCLTQHENRRGRT